MNIISIFGVLSSVGIICFTVDDFSNYDYTTRSIIFFALTQLLLGLKFTLESWVGDQGWIDELARRNAFIVEIKRLKFIIKDMHVKI
jgi:hypothetical protein